MLEAAAGAGSADWGDIGGLLSDQADLVAALAGKQPTGSYLTANQAITLSGDVGGTGSTAIAVTIGANKVTRAMLAAAGGATLLGATGPGNVSDLTPTQAKGVLAITASDVSGLAAIATSGSASDLAAGTVAAARLPAFSGGDVTSSAGSANLSIGAGKVTLAMQANMATASVVYRKTAGAGAPEVQSLATLKTDLGLIGTNSGDQTITLSGDVSGSGTGAITATIGANKVVDSMLRQGGALSVIGRSANSSGNVADIAGSNNTVLRVSGSVLGFGAVDISTAQITGRLPYANITAPSAASKLLARGSTTGDWQECSIDATLAFSTTTLSVQKVPNAVTFNTTGGAAAGSTFDGSAARTVDFSTVGAAKTGAITASNLTVSATSRFLGRIAAGSGAVEEMTGTQATSLLDTFTSALKGVAPSSGGGTLNFLRADGTWAAPPGTGGGLADGDYGDVVLSAGATVWTVESAAGAFTVAGHAEINDSFRVTGATTTPASGSGLEIIFGGSSSTISSRERGGANAWFDLLVRGLTIDIRPSGTTSAIFRSTGTEFVQVASPTNPAADSINFVPQRLNGSGGRVWPRWRDESAITTTMATHPGRNSIASGQAIGNATTAIAPVGIAALTAVGTATARNVASTSRLTRAKRLGYVSSAVAGNVGGLHNVAGNTQFTVGGAAGGGFLAVFRFAVSDASLVAGAHAIIGFRNATAAPTAATNPNTLTNIIALAQTNGSTNWQIVFGGSAAQTAVDTGMAVNITDLLEFTLYARPDVNNKVTWRLENISTGTVASGELTGTAGTALPANTTFLGPLMWRSNNATASAVGIDIVSFYIESDIA